MNYPLIDAHLHLFDLVQGDYHWLKEENTPFWPNKKIICQNFNEQHLTVNPPFELGGFIHIEAGFDNKKPWREIAWLESQCQLPFKSVAAIDLTLNKNDFIKQVDQLLHYQSVVGCRHILDEQAEEILQSEDIQYNLNYLATKRLSFDLQMAIADKTSLNLLVNLLKNIPTLTVIIDHAGWPPALPESKNSGDNKSKEATWLNWQAAINTLSQFEQCAIKCSGWEIIDKNYTIEFLEKVIGNCIDTFGDKRVMLASNFPLTLFNQSYNSLWQTYSSLNFTSDQLMALTSANAAYWYRLTF